MKTLTKKTAVYLMVFFFFAGSNLLFADPVDKFDAAFVARNFYEELNPVKNSDFTTPVIDQGQFSSRASSMQVAEEETHHVFEFEGGGFIIMSADDNAPPILGYSFDSEQANDEMPPQLEAMVQNYHEQILEIRENNLDNEDAQAQWDELLTDNFDSSELELDGDVGALIKTTWSQCTGYNNYAPSDGSAVCGNNRVPIGCVATAMGQVMKYHNYPAQGVGSHSYSSPYGTKSANFGTTTYAWGSMPNTYGNNAVSKLLYHCAVSVNMIFGPSGSGAYTSYVAPALKNYFGYDTSAKYVSKSSYTNSAWRSLMRGQIDAGQPVVYRGSGSGGHAFNVDGYKTSNNTFHLNWGWSGSYNGYYLLEDLTPGGYSFNSGQGAIIDIRPNPTPYLRLYGTIKKGDFNGDGNTDILNFYNKKVTIYLMDDTDIIESGAVKSFTSGWKVKGTGDLNGDGKSDIIMHNSKDGRLNVYLMDGINIDQGACVKDFTSGWRVKGNGDLNGDGKSDIIMHNSKDGRLNVYLMDGTDILSWETVWIP